MSCKIKVKSINADASNKDIEVCSASLAFIREQLAVEIVDNESTRHFHAHVVVMQSEKGNDVVCLH